MHRRSWVARVFAGVVFYAALTQSSNAASMIDLSSFPLVTAEIHDALLTAAYTSAHGSGTEFLSIKGKPEEAGYNTGTVLPLDTTSSKEVLISQLKPITIHGNSYFEFILNVSEQSGHKASIYLNSLKLFVSDAPAGASLSALGAPVFSLDSGHDRSVLLNKQPNGSEKIDMVFDVPASSVVAHGGKYLTLYSDFTRASGGAEKWSTVVAAVPEPPCAGVVSALAAVLVTRKRR